MNCLECGTRMKVGRENRADLSCGLPNVTLLGVEVRRCPKCGAEEVALQRVEDLHRALAHAVIHKAGRLTGKRSASSARRWIGAGRSLRGTWG